MLLFVSDLFEDIATHSMLLSGPVFRSFRSQSIHPSLHRRANRLADRSWPTYFFPPLPRTLLDDFLAPKTHANPRYFLFFTDFSYSEEIPEIFNGLSKDARSMPWHWPISRASPL